MHPDIEAFWSKRGDIDTDYLLDAEHPYKFWILYKDGKFICSLARIHTRKDEPIVYFLEDSTYTEAEMLRVIKLKAFF